MLALYDFIESIPYDSIVSIILGTTKTLVIPTMRKEVYYIFYAEVSATILIKWELDHASFLHHPHE